MDKKITLTDAIVDDIALYLGREHLVPRTPGVITYPPRADTMDAWRIVSAVLSHPDAAGLFAGEDDRPWEPLNKHDPLHVGDEVRRDHGGTTSIAVVGRVDKSGDPWTAEGKLIGLLRYGTWYVRRHIQELPTADGAVIIPAEGNEYITATRAGETWHARDAMLVCGQWHAAWRTHAGRWIGWVTPKQITPDVWQVDDQ